LVQPEDGPQRFDCLDAVVEPAACPLAVPALRRESWRPVPFVPSGVCKVTSCFRCSSVSLAAASAASRASCPFLPASRAVRSASCRARRCSAVNTEPCFRWIAMSCGVCFLRSSSTLACWSSENSTPRTEKANRKGTCCWRRSCSGFLSWPSVGSAVNKPNITDNTSEIRMSFSDWITTDTPSLYRLRNASHS